MYCLGNGGQDYTIKELGGAGAIMVLDAMTDIAYTFLVPGTLVIPKDGKKIEHYINTTKYEIKSATLYVLNQHN